MKTKISQSQGATFMITLILFMMTMLWQAESQQNKLTGLYIDRIVMWNTDVSEAKQTQSSLKQQLIKEIGLSEKQKLESQFTIIWRQKLQRVVSSGLSIYNFETGPGSPLSFRTNITQATITSASVSLSSQNKDIKLLYLVFSVIVITQVNNQVELHSFTYDYVQGRKQISQYVGSINTKIKLYDSFHPICLFQWMLWKLIFIPGGDTNTQASEINLMINESLIILRVSNREAFIGFKVNLLVVVQQNEKGFKNWMQKSILEIKSDIFNKQFFDSYIGKRAENFWFQRTYLHLHGISTINISLSNQQEREELKKIKFIFFQSQNVQQLIAYTYIFGTYDSIEISYSCSPLLTDCLSCSSNYICQRCAQGMIISKNKDQCLEKCLPGQYRNQTTEECQRCPFDCWSCNSTRHCLTCNQQKIFRELNVSTSRCQPLPGYFELNQKQIRKCPQHCISCSQKDGCFSCSWGYELESNKICQIIFSNFLSILKANIIVFLGVTLFLAIFCLVYKTCKKKTKYAPVPSVGTHYDLMQMNFEPSNALMPSGGAHHALVVQMAQESPKYIYNPSGQMIMIEGNEQGWRNRVNYSFNTVCGVCMNQNAQVYSNCGHSFHFQCLIDWCSDNENCINCEQSLKAKHLMYCGVCQEKERDITFQQIITQLSSPSQTVKLTHCNQCFLFINQGFINQLDE